MSIIGGFCGIFVGYKKTLATIDFKLALEPKF